MSLYSFNPKIIGIMATGRDGEIAISNRAAPFYARPADRKLDQSIMRNIIRTTCSGRSAFMVLGENTFNELNGTRLITELHNGGGGFIISSQYGLYILAPAKADDAFFRSISLQDGTVANFKKVLELSYAGLNVEMSRDVLLKTALACAYNADIELDRIIVLGGSSVYESFRGHYSELHVVELDLKYDSNQNIVKVKELASPAKGYTGSLIAYTEMMKQFDTSTMKYTTYVRGEK